MAMTTYAELRRKDVINVCDGGCLGRICDLEVDDCTGCICSIVVPGSGKMLGIFHGDEEIVIPFTCVKKIGLDVILVDIKI